MSAAPRIAVEDRRGGPDGEVAALPIGVDAMADLLAAVLAAEGAGAGSEAGLLVVDPEEMTLLNVEHLGGSGPTDVLSFPLDGVAGGAAERDGVGWMVGDVVVCPEVAVGQASDHAGRPEDELRLLVVHGGLHLCGWDHSDLEERRRMWDRERELMERFGYAPSGDPWGPE